jgi:hypothetical protein
VPLCNSRAERQASDRAKGHPPSTEGTAPPLSLDVENRVVRRWKIEPQSLFQLLEVGSPGHVVAGDGCVVHGPMRLS